MKNEKFCFNKSVGIIITVVMILGAFALAAFQLSTQPTSTSTRASEIKPISNLRIRCSKSKPCPGQQVCLIDAKSDYCGNRTEIKFNLELRSEETNTSNPLYFSHVVSKRYGAENTYGNKIAIPESGIYKDKKKGEEYRVEPSIRITTNLSDYSWVRAQLKICNKNQKPEGCDGNSYSFLTDSVINYNTDTISVYSSDTVWRALDEQKTPLPSKELWDLVKKTFYNDNRLRADRTNGSYLQFLQQEIPWAQNWYSAWFSRPNYNGNDIDLNVDLIGKVTVSVPQEKGENAIITDWITMPLVVKSVDTFK